jgi:hypothetical protein
MFNLFKFKILILMNNKIIKIKKNEKFNIKDFWAKIKLIFYKLNLFD